MGEKVQGIRSIIGRYKINKGRLSIVREMKKPKNLYARPMDMKGGLLNGRELPDRVGGAEWGKSGTTVIA